MADLNRVIRGLEALEGEAYSRWVHCQYTKDQLINGIGEYVPDAIALLKAQEAEINALAEKYTDLLDRMLEAQEPGWISVKNGLPPAHDLVIVSIKDNRCHHDYRYTDAGWCLTDGKRWRMDDGTIINVEAWMPMPKPYKPPKEE